MGNEVNTIQIQTDYVSIVEETVQYLDYVKSCCGKLSNAEDEQYQRLQSSFLVKMETLCDKFEHVAVDIPLEEISVHKAYFREKLHPIIMSSKIVERIFTKPLGYPGDYEMINMLMGETDLSSSDLFSLLIDEMHRTARTARAHKNRITMVGERLGYEVENVTKQERLFSVLCIGCGPALELQQFILNNEHSNNCFIHVVDFNQDSIDNIHQTLSDLSKVNQRNNIIEANYISLTGLLDSKSSNYIGNIQAYDMVYCAGLFDYIPDELCRKVVNFGYSCLRNSGVLTVTNIHPNVPNKQYLEHALEWNFIYRDENKLGLLSPSSLNSQVTTDETGLNVFLDVRRLN